MTFLSQRPNNDPEPYISSLGKGRFGVNVGYCRFDPRPEFDNTRDPQPWFSAGHRWSDEFKREIEASGVYWGQPWEWKPRREQFDVPVNRVLADIREKIELEGVDMNIAQEAENQLWNLRAQPHEYTPAEVAHARRVLSKIVAVYGNREEN